MFGGDIVSIIIRHFKIAFEDMSRHWRGRREKERH